MVTAKKKKAIKKKEKKTPKTILVWNERHISIRKVLATSVQAMLIAKRMQDLMCLTQYDFEEKNWDHNDPRWQVLDTWIAGTNIKIE